MILHKLEKQKLITPPSWLCDNTQFLCIVGSMSYGVSTDNSDMDYFGYTIPPKQDIFPNEIVDFDGRPAKERFQHFITKAETHETKYDISIFNIVKYFKLCLECNPNLIDTLFTSQKCIVHATQISDLIRDNRKIFLSKLIWPKFKNYAYRQLHKSESKNPKEGSKRKELREQFGMDVKYLYNIVRLLSECEQILLEGDLDLEEPSRREHMKEIRRGNISEKEIKEWASNKEKSLEELYLKSKLPDTSNPKKVKELLLNCLEIHYGSLSNNIQQPDWAMDALKEYETIANKYRNRLYSI